MPVVSAPDFKARAKKIKLLVMDVDGVLTDGRVLVDEAGRESALFSRYDGIAVNELCKQAGIKTVFLTREKAGIAASRGRKLGVDEVFSGILDKAASLKKIAEKYGVKLEEIAFMGDDTPDLPAMKLAGLAIYVPTMPCPALEKFAHYVTSKKGGEGAVREAVELILAAKGIQSDFISGTRSV